MSRISIIIPTYNEANNLPLLLADLSILQKEGEIIIIDCGSKDKSKDIANIYGAKLLKSKDKNRGSQLHIGAKKAEGEWFIFLHADSRLTKDWLKRIKLVMENSESFVFYFKFKVNNQNKIYRFLEVLVNLRCFFFKTPYGDQGLLINRKTYFKNKGYRKIPIMEDLDFIQRLKNKTNLKSIKFPIYTSSRKWGETNIFIQALRNWKLRRRWLKGGNMQSIYVDYYKK